MNTVTVTDLTTNAVFRIPTYDVADAVRSWYPEAPAEIVQACDALQHAIETNSPERDALARFLDLRVTGPTGPTAM